MATDEEQIRQGPHLVVCGDNPLAYRLVEELVTQMGN
ncbi:MAG: hypothetical protein QOG46_981, partial [Pseudonocardiales bacterium]|nr:hypothetical protein [Pseudonocardiales bacterium]